MINFKDQNMKSIDDISDPPIFLIKFFKIYNFEIKNSSENSPRKIGLDLSQFHRTAPELQIESKILSGLVVESNHLTTEFGCLAKFCYYTVVPKSDGFLKFSRNFAEIRA